ncbi:MAG TPA: M14 family zinc carboxypeptidase [Euzebyales bacterium]
MGRWSRRLTAVMVVALVLGMLVASGPVAADPGGPWWDVEPEEENPSPFYDSILYSEIGPKLREIETSSNRVHVEVAGQSAGGRDLYLAVVSAPEAMGRLGRYKAISNMMLKDPERAQQMIAELGDYKVPLFINGSIHGNEYPGTDAAIRLIETLAYGDSPEVQAVLDNVILIVNVVQNPDGRVLGIRQNVNGFDLNRDFLSQTQPEARATVEILTEWNPLITLDLHGFVNPMLIEPTTPPHNTNYEYDLYLRWALHQAYAMEDSLFDRLGLPAQIPYRDFADGWDDWGGQYVPMYAMYHGSYGHTLETPSRAELGVDAHEAAVWGALNFVVENKDAMLHDQVEIFRRGALDLPQMPIPDELLDETQFNQYNELVVQEFPTAHVIPVDEPLQQSPLQAQRLVDFLLFNDVEVEAASQPFTVDGTTYPAGTYVVWMDQAKRSLANTFLEDGKNLSDVVGITFYSPPAVWSHPLLWGATRTVVDSDLDVATRPVTKATAVHGEVSGNRATAYAFEPTSLQAFRAANELIADGVAVRRAAEVFTDGGHTFEPGSFIVPGDRSLVNALASQDGLDVYALGSVPDSVAMEAQKIAVFADEGTRHALDQLGFEYDTVGTGDVNSGVVEDYDVFVNYSRSWGGLQQSGRDSLAAFFAAGGDYVGLRSTGIGLALDAGILDAEFDNGDGNAIVEVDYTDNGAAGGYPDDDVAFVFTPAWFTSLGPDVDVAATLGADDFLISGYWPGWEVSGAAGRPIVVSGDAGDADVTLIGLDATFRGHPENAFRLLGNGIFEGLD